MIVTFSTNVGIFSGYLDSDGMIHIYENEEDCPTATISAPTRRQPVLDTSANGVMRAVRAWLEQTYERLEIEVITARINPTIGS